MIIKNSSFGQAVLLAMGPAIAIGIARFAYGLILPAMKSDLAWTYFQSGLMNTINALGYLFGALVMGQLARRHGAARVFYIGMAVTVVAILLLGTTRDFVLLGVFRLVAGLSGAAIFVAGGTVISEFARRAPSRSGVIVSIFYAGPGFGIVVTAIVAPLLLARYGDGGWPLAWVALGAIGLVGCAASIIFRQKSAVRTNEAALPQTRYRPSSHVKILVAYILFGAGSIGYMTFMVTSLQESGLGPRGAAIFWLLIGSSSILAPAIWGRSIGRLNHGHAFSLLACVNAVGAVLPLLSSTLPMILLSAVIFGSTFFSVVATTTAFAARNIEGPGLSTAISYFSLAFGAGQAAGPLAIGLISDGTGSVTTGLGLGVAVILFGAVLGIFQRDDTRSAP